MRSDIFAALVARRQRTGRGLLTSAVRVLLCLLVCLCCVGTACRPSENPAAGPPPTLGGLDQPLTSFRQNLTSSTTSLALHPGQEIRIPVRVENPGSETWVSVGRYPVTISYKWFNGTVMLPIEGERTVLPGPIGPNQALNVEVRVVAPNQPGNFTLRITLVQEAVAWFMAKSNIFLQLPASVK